MTTEPARDEEFKGISSLHASRLLELGLSRDRTPIDGLVARLRAPDGAAWLRQVLASGLLGSASDLDALSSPAGASLEVLRSIKDRGNALLRDPSDRERLQCGMAGYFLAIAGGLAQHGELLTHQPREKIDPILRKLASAAPEPWASLCERALAVKSSKAKWRDEGLNPESGS